MGKRIWDYTPEFRAKVVKEFRTYDEPRNSAQEVADRHGVRRDQVYQWARQALRKPRKKVDVEAPTPDGIQSVNFRVRSRADAQKLVDYFRAREIPPGWNDAGNGWHFITVWVYESNDTLAPQVAREFPQMSFDCRGRKPDVHYPL